MGDINQRLLSACNKQQQRVLGAIEKRTRQSVREQWVLDSVTPLDGVIESQTSNTYRLPVHFNAIIPPSDLLALQTSLQALHAMNEGCVGMTDGEVLLQLGQDERFHRLIDELYATYDRVIAHRLNRTNPKDRGNAFRRFLRIYNELLPGMDRILEAKQSINPMVLNPVQDYGAWRLFERTWRPWVERSWRGYRLSTALGRQHHPRALQLLDLYRWGQDDDLERVVEWTDCADPCETSRLLTELEGMADDLTYMRPLMAFNFDPLKTIVQVGPKLWVLWQWHLRQLGAFGLAPSERELVEAYARCRFPQLLGVDYAGIMSIFHMPWCRADRLALPNAIAANHRLLKAIHAPLLEMYCKIDVDAILARYRSAGAAEPEAPGSAPAVVAALAEVDQRASTPDLTRRIRGLRMNRLLDALSKLGCSTRQGKGSEIIVFRPGHAMARLGRHKRNPEVSPYAVCNALRRLGLTASDLVRAFDESTYDL